MSVISGMLGGGNAVSDQVRLEKSFGDVSGISKPSDYGGARPGYFDNSKLTHRGMENLADQKRLTMLGKPIDESRPKIENDDGSFSTERSITVGQHGKFYNIPTIVNGKQYDPEEALKLYDIGENPHVGIFDTKEAAEKAAKTRSNEIGKRRGGNR